MYKFTKSSIALSGFGYGVSSSAYFEIRRKVFSQLFSFSCNVFFFGLKILYIIRVNKVLLYLNCNSMDFH